MCCKIPKFPALTNQNQKKSCDFSLAKICVLLSYFFVGECNTGVVGCAKERQVVNLRIVKPQLIQEGCFKGGEQRN